MFHRGAPHLKTSEVSLQYPIEQIEQNDIEQIVYMISHAGFHDEFHHHKIHPPNNVYELFFSIFRLDLNLCNVIAGIIE